MPYYPKDEERSYHCPNCKQWYIPTGLNCLVNHPPGTCCHLYDTITTDPTPPYIKDMAQKMKEYDEKLHQAQDKKPCNP